MYQQVNLDAVLDSNDTSAHKQTLSSWTGNISEEEFADHEQVLQRLCDSFNASPFVQHIGMQMQVVHGQIQGYIDMQPHLIGNTDFRILHGGGTAAFLDSIGGIVAMGEIYRHKDGLIEEQRKKAARLATMDMRIDYLSPGRGEYFIATAQAVRMGRKGCTVRMELTNNEGKMIAIGTAVYAY